MAIFFCDVFESSRSMPQDNSIHVKVLERLDYKTILSQGISDSPQRFGK
jgi:hypothetical protein